MPPGAAAEGGKCQAEGWTAEAIAEHAFPALQSSFMPLDTSGQLFAWDPL